MDIAAAVRLRLSAPLAEKLKQVEGVLGRSVRFLEDKSLPGGAGGSAAPDGTVRLAPGAANNLNVIGEEIMHLHRWTAGYPVIEPGPLAKQWGYARALTQLAGHFDEYAFFPFLESIGLNPREELTHTLEPAARALRDLLPQIKQNGATAECRVLLSVNYVQARIIAPESISRDELLKLFHDPVLTKYAVLGHLLCDEVTAAQDENAGQVEEHMGRCVYQHLNLSPKAATVRRLY